ncbi:MAG: CCA tRNA nucleotidyltransferase [Pseudomonadota bacterium]
MNCLDREAFFVGGCVRNALLHQTVADIDIATPLVPDEVIRRADASGLKVVPTGLSHGTVTLISHGKPFEVTTFRKDIETDGRHAIVAFSTTMSEDAARRDFTLNALYADSSGMVIDPLGTGLDDLSAGRVRFILDPAERIREDSLRILRFFRFTAWYADRVDTEGTAACAALADQIDGLAKERVGQEFRKLLAAPQPVEALHTMDDAGVLGRCLPGASPAGLSRLVSNEQTTREPVAWMTRLAALGSDDPESALRLGRSEARSLDKIRRLRRMPLPAAVAAAEYGRDTALAAALLDRSDAARDWIGFKEELARGATAVFPLSASDLSDRGIADGQEMGAMLKSARAVWLEGDLTPDRDQLLATLFD